MIELYRVSKEYPDGRIALRDVNLHVPLGQMIFLMGESGAGKSTLMKLLYREELATSGRVLMGRLDISKISDLSQLRRRIGLISQNVTLLPHLNVFDNVAYILRANGASPKEIHYRVEGALNVVGLLSKIKSMTGNLSGGERQRVGIARAIVTNPPILLADEPTGNLDSANSFRIFQLFNEINDKLGMTMVITTHAVGIEQFEKRIVKLAHGTVQVDTQPSFTRQS